MSKSEQTKFISPCLCFNLRRAARAATKAYDDYFRPIGLKGTQYSVLAAINRLDNPTVGVLSQELGLEQSTATRNIELLLNKGYLAFKIDQTDSRRKLLSLTPTGLKKLKEAIPVWEKAQIGIMENLGEQECRRLLRMLNQVIVKLEKPEE